MKELRGFIAFCIFAVAFAKVSYKGFQVIRSEPQNLSERKYLQYLGNRLNLKFWKEPDLGLDFVDMLVPKYYLEAVKESLREARIRHHVLIKDVNDAIKAHISPRKPQYTLDEFQYDRYHTFEEIESWLESYATAHSSYLTRLKVGTSYENRDFYSVKISTGGENKPAFAIDCGIHSREWIAPATCINIINRLTTSIGTETQIGKLLEAIDFYVIPLANPDGYVYTWTTDRLWRKTRSPQANNCYGVDPNRNWGSNFGGNGSSNDPCSDSYHGPYVWSEAIVRAQRDFVNGIQNLQAYIDVHSYSQLWMFPYGYTYDRPSDFDVLIIKPKSNFESFLQSRIADESVVAIKKVNGEDYTPGQISHIIYVASGSTSDYFYDHLKLKCAFGAELRDKGKYGMLLPEYEIIPTFEETLAGILVIAENIKLGYCQKS